MAISWCLNGRINPSILYPLFNTSRSGCSPNTGDISQHLDSNWESTADISLDLWKFMSCFHNFPGDISLDLWWKSMCSFHHFPADISLDLWKFMFFSPLIYHAKGSSDISLSIWQLMEIWVDFSTDISQWTGIKILLHIDRSIENLFQGIFSDFT